MAYKISGTKNATSRIIVMKESDWSIESNTIISGTGAYEIEVIDGAKTVLAESTSGETLGYGNVSPIYSAPVASWLTYFDDTYWEPATGMGLPQTGHWDGSKWVADQDTGGSNYWYLVIRPKGSWATGFRPTTIRTYFNLETVLPLQVYSASDSPGVPSIIDIADYTEGTESAMGWTAGADIAAYWIVAVPGAQFEVTNIEFYGIPV